MAITKYVDAKDCVLYNGVFSNNDASEKKVAFLSAHEKDVVLDGENINYIFNGRITPIVVDHCKNVVIKNFNIDFDRPFYTQGKIEKVRENFFDLKIDDGFDFEVKNGEFIAKGKFWECNLNSCPVLMQEFDENKTRVAYNGVLLISKVGKGLGQDPKLPMPLTFFEAELIGERLVRFSGSKTGFKVGNRLVITHELRLNPCIAITNCENVRIENITMRNGGAMGLICQLSKNITVQNVKVNLKESDNKLCSMNCDALHFVNCCGKIKITACILENMMDDGINIHGVYTKVKKVEGNTVYTSIMHYQQQGVNFFKKGDKLHILKENSNCVVGKKKVLNSELVDDCTIKLTLNNTKGIVIGANIENMTATPKVYIRNIRTGNNRPRGVLLTTPRRAKILDSVFYNAAFGIHIAGDTDYWYESGAVRKMLISGNKFLNCGCQGTDYAIGITPSYSPCDGSEFFHKNIRIINNNFCTFTDGMVYATGVDKLKVKRNNYEMTKEYPKRCVTNKCTTVHCNNIKKDCD